MATEYCTFIDLKTIVLDTYLDKVEELNPGIVTQSMEIVFNELDERLNQHFNNYPPQFIPEALSTMAKVFACYRIIGSIPSLMNENSFFYLAEENTRQLENLERIINGQLLIGLEPIT